MVDEITARNCIKRLRKIEGQIEGIRRMIEDKRYCIDIINQITAAKRALEQVALIIMKNHIETCLYDAIKKGKKSDASSKIEELITTINKFLK